MQTYNELNINQGLSLALGFFDGVHLGHQSVIKSAVDFAKANGTKSAVITFQDHPCCYFYDVKPQYIIKKVDKIKLLEKLGVDYLYFIKFDDYIAKMTADEYMHEIIIKNFAPKAISTGFNHYFGAKKTGNVNYLMHNQEKYNYKYFEVNPVLHKNDVISSTVIRNNISAGNIDIVNAMLGYNYFLEDKVIKGQQLGRQMGYRTANLLYPDNLVDIGFGVYKVNVVYDGNKYLGMANYGTRPTVSNKLKPVLEVHILDFDKDIYGETIKVEFIKKIRDERKFNSLGELKNQIALDINSVKA